jgi:fatty-acyl-CoA synthase
VSLVAESLSEALLVAAARGCGELNFHLEGGAVHLPHDELADRALTAARALAARGIGPGDAVGVIGPNRPEWAVWAFAAWISGATLVPLQIPLRVRDPASFREQVRSLIETAGCRVVMADPRLLAALPEGVAVSWNQTASGRAEVPPPPEPDDAAIIQFTSGSTAAPKGAVLTHRAVMAQMRILGEILGSDPGQAVLVGWVPFFHDLGLLLYLVAPVAWGATCHVIPTERFARDPTEWLRLVGSTRATAAVAPASAFGAAVQYATRRGDHLDLSSLEIAWFAAEGVDPEVVDRVLESGKQFGLREEALGTTYGLAEAVLAVTSTRPNEGLRSQRVDLAAMATARRAVPAGNGPARRIFSCGRPAPGTEVRIRSCGEDLPERQVGEVYVRGPSTMRGYVGDPDADPFVDGWLRTGDIGYMSDGELYIAGRAKDVVVVMGHNYYPEDFEWAAGRVPGVRTGRCVAFALTDSEEVVLLVEPRPGTDPGELSMRVRGAVRDAVGIAPAEVLVLPRGAIEKTTSGKLRRSAMKDAYMNGRLGHILDGTRRSIAEDASGRPRS